MPTYVDSRAAVDPRARIGEDVHIGPFCVVGPHVEIGRGCRLENNVTITGHTTIGEYNHFYPGVVIGAPPQDLSYQGTDTRVQIGDHNVFRESVTVNRASEKEEGVTIVGSHGFFMACSHIAHDCRVGDYVVTANGVLMGGHVHIHDHVTLSGATAIHHFATVGAFAFVSGMSRVLHDVPPFMLADGSPARARCVNVVALKRNNFSQDQIRALAEAHRLVYRAKVGLDQAREILRANRQLIPVVNHMLSFVQTQLEGRHGRARDRRRAA
ncbi:MAG TPA: acyl-ACP--UDP-N-acetylglucosamine O-acyltransferase [Planctomycetaceae bacterium]|nr:acyl-ACP--UDP-N-acetylglucosamine O-acyltransferase [Planctomycetaceae bacterium]